MSKSKVLVPLPLEQTSIALKVSKRLKCRGHAWYAFVSLFARWVEMIPKLQFGIVIVDRGDSVFKIKSDNLTL